MPKLPKLPNLNNFPRPPRLSQIIKKGNPLREVVEDAREVIKGTREEISDIASSLRVEGIEEATTEVEPEPEVEEDEIKGGTAGNLCSDEHLVQAAANITEALRMARSRGIKDREVRDRIKAARSELNQMERFDITAEKIVTYPREQQEIAHWLLPRSSAMRHQINEILMRDKDIEDLEKVAAYGNTTASRLTDLIDALPKEQKESDACLEIKQLPAFLEEMRLKKGEVGVGDIKRYLEERK